MDENREFSICEICGRDIAKWKTGGINNWWHLDQDLRIDHLAKSGFGKYLFLTSLSVFECSYEKEHLDAVGEIEICQIHHSNSKFSFEFGLHRPCLIVAPY